MRDGERWSQHGRGRVSGIDWTAVRAVRWRARERRLQPLMRLAPQGFDALVGLDRQKRLLRANVEQFLAGRPANHMLLWGARGTGKSSLVRALPAEFAPRGLRIVEVDRDDLADLPDLLEHLPEGLGWRFLIYCDDLAFGPGETGYRHLKTLIEGGLEAPPEHVRLIVTSNRRHLVPEYRRDNLDARIVDGELHEAEAVDEAIALADRFGLALSFPPYRHDEFLAVVDALFPKAGDRTALHVAADRFARARGNRSARTAVQFHAAAGGDADAATRLGAGDVGFGNVAVATQPAGRSSSPSSGDPDDA